MLIRIIFLILVVLTQANAAPVIPIALQDVVKRVSENNYKVYENALKVYQAKSNIEKARADLLPRLNLWNLAGMIFDPTSIVENIPDVAPFLVPGNWFRLEEIKLLYLAEKEGYRALWGNELFIAKSLYLNILLDQRIYKHIEDSIVELQKIHRIIKTREMFGGARPGTARDIEIRILGLIEDKEKLRVLLAQENDSLSYLLGYPADQELSLSPVNNPIFEDFKPIDGRDFEFRMLASSPERRQYYHFFSVLSQIKKEIQYSFLGASSISRGVAGGVFDTLPVGNGIGLGDKAAMKIVDAQRKIMETQKAGVEETLRRQLRAVVGQFNSDVVNYDNFKKRFDLAKGSKESLIRRVQLGEDINVVELSESSRNQIQAETGLLVVQFRFLNLVDRLNRLVFEGDYSMNPPMIESLQGGRL